MERVALFLVGISLIDVGTVFGYCPERNDDALEEGRKCKKSCTHHDECLATNKGCYCDSECGLSCFNKDSECEDHPEIADGSVFSQSRLVGGVAYYSCHDGFVLKGRESRKCNGDKKWGGNSPTCKRGCPLPGDVDNSYPSEGGSFFLVGKAYTFSCNSGFYMTGNSTRICMSLDEGWPDAEYSCIPEQCDSLNTVENGELNFSNGYFVGSTVTVRCHEGYKITSENQLKRCYPGDSGSTSGTWRGGDLPRCLIQSCPSPVAPVHGSIKHLKYVRFEYGVDITYQCDTGYKIKGPKTGRCNLDRNWGGLPLCIENLDCDFTESSTPVCGYKTTTWERVLTTSQNGLRGYAAQSGNQNSYLVSMSLPRGWTTNDMCLTFHYKLSFGRSLKVENVYDYRYFWTTHPNEISSFWLDGAITISVNTILKFQFHANGHGVLLDDVTALPEKCENNCALSPCHNGATCFNRINDYTCFCTKDFTGRYCTIDKKCPQPPESIPNGARMSLPSRLLLPPVTARYECNNHHKFVGERGIVPSKTVRCVRAGRSQRGEWTTALSSLRCEAITCSSLTSRPNGRLLNPQSSWFVNDKANFECKNGYIGWNRGTQARMYALCKSTGEWSDGPPECIRPHCTYKPSSEGTLAKPVFLQNKYPVGSEIFFKCKVGYKLLGSRSIRCDRMSRWRGRVPTCGKIQCADPLIIPNAHRRQNRANGYGATWWVRCQQGYFLDGPQETKCLWNGTWSAAPICTEVSQGCRDDLPAPDNGRKQSHGNREITFQCNQMYRLSGDIRVHCGSDNRWHGSPPACVEASANAFANIDGLQYLAFSDDTVANYSDAQNLCRCIDGNLAIIYNATLYREITKLILNKIEHYVLMYIGLKKFSDERDAYEWDVGNISTNLPTYWTKRKDRFWDYSKGNRQHRCVTLRDISHGKTEKHKWWRTDCDHKLAFFCQRNARPCRPNPCHNGGQCREEGGGVTCDCLEHYAGMHCKEEITCHFPSLLQRGVKELTRSVFSVGEKIPLLCDEGFEPLMNFREATCLANREWDIQPNCREITCRIPNLPPQAVNNQQRYEVGSTIYIACQHNFELVGNAVLQCQLDGSWTTAKGSCQPITCYQPNLPRGAYLRQTPDTYAVNTQVKIFCHEGFANTGRMFLRCRADKTWSPSEASIECREIETETTSTQHIATSASTTTVRTTTTTDSGQNLCSSPELAQSLYVLDNVDKFPSGTTISLGCLGSRTVVGEPNLTCNNGNWTPSNVSCVVQSCRLDSFLLAMARFGIFGMRYQDLDKKVFPMGQEVTLTCIGSDQPTHKDDPNTPPTITCQEGGGWSPKFSEFRCPAPE